jgi:hypothetical protein
MLMASAWDLRQGCLYLLRAGWESATVTNLGDQLDVGMVMTFECAGVDPGEYAITLRATGPNGDDAYVVFPLTVEKRGDILRLARVHLFQFIVTSFGLWTLTAEHDGRVLGTVDLNVKRTAEALNGWSQAQL